MKKKSNLKKCTQCKKEFPDTKEFYFRNGFKKNGEVRRHSFCRFCQNEVYKRNYTTAKNRFRQQRDIGKTRATRTLQGAVESGRLDKEPCWFCGDKTVEAHHLLYEYALKVIWLCRIHHNQVHHG